MPYFMLDIDSMENILPAADEYGDKSSENDYIEFKPCNVSALQIAIVNAVGEKQRV
jgi:hypothetical protein